LRWERGEVEALSLPWPVLRNENRDWISGHKVNLLLQTGLQKNADLPDLPRMIDLAKTKRDRKVFEIFVASSVVRPLLRGAARPAQGTGRGVALSLHGDGEVARILGRCRADTLRHRRDVGAELQAFFASATYAPAAIERAKEIAKLAGH